MRCSTVFSEFLILVIIDYSPHFLFPFLPGKTAPARCSSCYFSSFFSLSISNFCVKISSSASVISLLMQSLYLRYGHSLHLVLLMHAVMFTKISLYVISVLSFLSSLDDNYIILKIFSFVNR